MKNHSNPIKKPRSLLMFAMFLLTFFFMTNFSFADDKKISLSLENLSVINKECALKKVTLFTKRGCIYCKLLKSTLDKNEIKYEDFDVTDDQKMRSILVKNTSWKTFPYVFINDEFVGGYSDYINTCEYKKPKSTKVKNKKKSK